MPLLAARKRLSRRLFAPTFRSSHRWRTCSATLSTARQPLLRRSPAPRRTLRKANGSESDASSAFGKRSDDEVAVVILNLRARSAPTLWVEVLEVMPTESSRFAGDLYGAFSVTRLFWFCCHFFLP